MKKTLFVTALLFMATITPQFLFGQRTGNNGESAIVLEYQDFTVFNDEPSYKLLEENVNMVGYAYCDATNKLYVLDNRQNIIEYDLKNALSSGIRRTKSFHISFAPETKNNTMVVSPNGKWLAFVDIAGDNLHVIDISSEQETGSCKLGEKYHNALYNNTTDFGHPFNFVSDNEIIVAGSEKALLYNVEKDKQKTISFDKEFKKMTARWVTTKGTITGFGNMDVPPRPFDMVTFFLKDGKIKKTEKEMAVIEYLTFYRYYHHYELETIECYEKQSGKSIQIPIEYLDSDLNKYNIKNNQSTNSITLFRSILPFRNYSPEEINQYNTLKPYALEFNNLKTWSWLKDYQLLLISRNDNKIQIFNHTLTDDEIPKQVLRNAINTQTVEALTNYIGKSSNARYADYAKQKRAELINSEWQRLSNRSDLSYDHVHCIIDFISKYKDIASLDAAEEKLDQLYKEILERIPKDNVDQFKNYISEYPQSPYLDLAKKRLINAEEQERQEATAALQITDISEGLVAYYPFDGNANDFSGYGNHGYVYNTTLAPGHDGQCFHFGGYDDQSVIIVPRSKSLTFSNAVSYSFWFKLDSYMGWGTWGTRGDYGIMNFFTHYGMPLSAELKGNDDNSFHITLKRDKDVFETDIEGNPINHWYHVVLVETNTTSTIYINGKKVASGSRSTSLSNSKGDLYIGHNRNHFYPFFGCIDELMIFNRAVSDMEATALYNGKKPEAAKLQQIAKTLPKPSAEEDKFFVVNGELFVMKFVEGGSKRIGDYNLDVSKMDNMTGMDKITTFCDCPHEVILSDYYMGEYPVTENIWNAVMGSIPSANPGPTELWQVIMPVENVSWYDCIEFINRLNALTGENFRLPTEAEWEYAAREGQAGTGYLYSGRYGNIEAEYAHQSSNRRKLSINTSYGPNKLGIWCMSGWVYEWCSDGFDFSYFIELYELEQKGIIVKDPTGASNCAQRIIRGGSFLSDKYDWKVNTRGFILPSERRNDIGLRLVLPAKQK